MDRITAKVSGLRLVGAAADLDAAIGSSPKAVPAAFVLASERGQKPAGASGGVLMQQIDVAVQVVLMVRNLRDSATGSQARADMDAITDAADAALLNWPPSIEHDPFWFDAGRDERFDGGLLVHQRIYRTRRRNQIASNP